MLKASTSCAGRKQVGWVVGLDGRLVQEIVFPDTFSIHEVCIMNQLHIMNIQVSVLHAPLK